jgi:hypothetical protein
MTALSLLDLIERPSILGVDRPSERALRPARERSRLRTPEPAHLLELFERERRDRHERDRPARVPAPSPQAAGAATLDDLLTGTWDTLTAGRTATCPMCAGPMEPRYAAGPIAVGGRCGRCATELS